MDIRKIEEQGVIILAPDGRLDSNSAPLLEQEIGLIGSDDNGHHLLLDFSRVEYISSAGLRVVLKTVKERQAASKSFAVSNMRNRMMVSGKPRISQSQSSVRVMVRAHGRNLRCP